MGPTHLNNDQNAADNLGNNRCMHSGLRDRNCHRDVSVVTWFKVTGILIVVVILLLWVIPHAKSSESWKMEIHYTVTDERICAHYDFDTKDSCERTKDWFVEHTAWHGKNKYQCILESQCP